MKINRGEDSMEDKAPMAEGAQARPLVLQFQPGATEPTRAQLDRLRAELARAFPGRVVVLLPCGIEVAPGSQEELMRISGKLDQLIEVLADEDVDEVRNVASVSLSGEPLGRERDQTKGLG